MVEKQIVTVNSFVRAETDLTFKRYVAQGAFGQLLHIHQAVPLDWQDVIRMNRDTLYSISVFDLTEPITIVKPNSQGRFQSMLVINQDHSMLPIEHYDTVPPRKNDCTTPHSLTVKDVPLDGFWSITVYNKNGFMEPNDQNANSYNNVTARKKPDGSITINFGGGSDAINNLPITPGWNYAARFYHPRQETLEGSWRFPVAQPVLS